MTIYEDAAAAACQLAHDINSAWDVWPHGRYCRQCNALNDMADNVGYYFIQAPGTAADDAQSIAICLRCWLAGGYTTGER